MSVVTTRAKEEEKRAGRQTGKQGEKKGFSFFRGADRWFDVCSLRIG
jgi:hypothetical protein